MAAVTLMITNATNGSPASSAGASRATGGSPGSEVYGASRATGGSPGSEVYGASRKKGLSFYPPTVEGIQLTYSRRGSPGTLKFTVLKDQALGEIGGFAEGSAVTLQVEGKPLFYGFIFVKKRDKAGAIECTAYDQIRYLKNKDIYVYEDKTAAEVVQMLAADYGLKLGEIEPTGYTIASRTEENVTLLDMIETALDLELSHKGQMFVLYDDFGSLTLKNIANMRVDLLINAAAAENFDYTSSIDEQTYNQIKLAYANKETGKWETYIAKDGEHINLWGLLQYFDTLQEKERRPGISSRPILWVGCAAGMNCVFHITLVPWVCYLQHSISYFSPLPH